MTLFLKRGSTFHVTSPEELDMHEALPLGTYTVHQNQLTGEYYLDTIDSFVVSGKLYGDTSEIAARILGTFDTRENSTGVLLSGEKGSGKTLLAKVLSSRAATLGWSTVVINEPWFGEGFNEFMQNLDAPTVVIFDEFEKVYNSEQQEKLLTLLDGTYPSKKLFILTCNDKYRVNAQMKNRPGRIFYRIDYTGLSSEFITEYCEDNLHNQSHTETLVRIAGLFGEFNFDMLKAVVEEMNRYGETPQEALKFLNAKPEYSDKVNYSVVMTDTKGKTIQTSRHDWSGNPLSEKIELGYYDENEDYHYFVFEVTDLKDVDSEAGKFLFESKEGRLTLERVRPAVFNLAAF